MSSDYLGGPDVIGNIYNYDVTRTPAWQKRLQCSAAAERKLLLQARCTVGGRFVGFIQHSNCAMTTIDMLKA